MSAPDTAAILALAQTPIPGPMPCGEDLADNPDHIFIVSELDKLGRIDAGGDPDWYQIEQRSIELLKSKSKDLQIAVAYGLALYKRNRYAGLAAGLRLLLELINCQWDGLFPSRHRRRKALVEFLTERFTEGGWFRENVPEQADFDSLDQSLEHAKSLRDALSARMPDDKPEIDKFIRSLADLAASRPKAPQDPALGTSATGLTGNSMATFTAQEILDPKGAIVAIAQASAFLRKIDLADPRPYALIRILEWSKTTLPPIIDGTKQKTAAEGPGSEQREAIQSAFKESKWEDLLKTAEAAFRRFPLWLDLQWFVCKAMSYLGPAFDTAQKQILTMTAELAGRLGSGVFDLRFENETPFCSSDTKLWIQQAGAPAGGHGGSSNGQLTEAYNKACVLAGSGKLKEAIQELLAGSSSSSQRRDRLLWRLRLAQLCSDMQHHELARPLLESCFEEIRKHQIDEWEPTLAAEVAQSLYRCRKALVAQHKPPENDQRQLPADLTAGLNESFSWLCRLDPLAALASEPGSK